MLGTEMRCDIGQTMSSCHNSNVLEALRRTSKGKLIYDNNWKEDGRTKEIVNSIKQGVSSISLAPNNSTPLLKNNIQNISNVTETSKLNLSNGTVGLTHKVNHRNDVCNNSNSSLENFYDPSIKDETTSISTSSSRTSNNYEVELFKSYEQERSDKVLKNSEEYTNKMLERKETIMETMEGEMRLIQKKYLLLAIQSQKREEEEEAQRQKELEQLAKSTSTAPASGIATNKGANLKLKEIEERHKLLMKQEENKRLEQQQFKLAITKCKESISKIVQECEQHQQEQTQIQLEQSVTEELNSLKTQILISLHNLDVFLLTAGEFSSQDVQSGQKELQKSIELKQKFFDIIKLQATKSKPDPTSTTVPQASEPNILQPSTPAATGTQKSTQDSAKSKVSQVNDQFSEAAKNIYIRTQLQLEEFEDKCNIFSQNSATKQRRGELQRFVRTTINQVCNQPVNKLAEKAVKLVRLLSGQEQEDRTVKVRCNSEDNSLYFTINDAAKAFLNVSVKQKNMSVKLAPVVVFIWARMPLFGQIFLAQLFRNCPYAVPYYPTMEKGQSKLEYMVTCGYQLNSEGHITETEEMFQERMFAMLQLYSAIIQCNMMKGHPRDLHYAWNWLARVLNDTPKPRLTALMLDAFLSVSSHKLLRVYGRQFVKMLRYIKNVYLRKIIAVTIETESKQTMMKFTTLVEQIERKINTSRDAARELAQTLDLVPDYFFA